MGIFGIKTKKTTRRHRRKQSVWVGEQAATSDQMVNTLKQLPILKAPIASKRTGFAITAKDLEHIDEKQAFKSRAM